MVASHAFLSLPRPPLQCSLSSKNLRMSSSMNLKSTATSVSLHNSRPLSVRAGSDVNNSNTSSSTTTTTTTAKIRRTPASESSSSLQTVFVEDESVSVEGVAKVDRATNSSSNDSSWGRVAFLVGGDIIALLAFAAIGRLSHGMSVLDFDAFRTADPFIAGWLLGAYLLGGYGPEGQGVNGFSKAITATLKSWAVGIPMALVIRGVTSGHVPAQPFIIVSMASTLVLLVGWRASVSVVFPYEKKGNNKGNGNRKGSIFELFQLLSSLVRRW